MAVEVRILLRHLRGLLTGRDLGLIAAGVAFYGFLAVFPALPAVIALWGFAADPVAIRGQLALAADYLPPDCAFHGIRPAIPRASGHLFHADPATPV